MKKITAFAFCTILSACAAGTNNSGRRPASVITPVERQKVEVRCGSSGAEVISGTVEMPEISDCKVSPTGRPFGSDSSAAYFRIDCSAKPISFSTNMQTYVSQNPAQDLVFEGVCGRPGSGVKNCADLGAVNFASLDQSSPKGRRPQLDGVNYDVPELHVLKSKAGNTIELIVGKSADGSALEAKGIFRGCTIEDQ